MPLLIGIGGPPRLYGEASGVKKSVPLAREPPLWHRPAIVLRRCSASRRSARSFTKNGRESSSWRRPGRRPSLRCHERKARRSAHAILNRQLSAPGWDGLRLSVGGWDARATIICFNLHLYTATARTRTPHRNSRAWKPQTATCVHTRLPCEYSHTRSFIDLT